VDATQSEQWLPVVGREGEYEVSDQGRVRSMERTIEYVHGKTGKLCTRRAPSKVLSAAANPTGHRYVVLGNRSSRTVHSLVADAFLGPRPDGWEVRHLNGQAYDNRPANLQYGTRSENAEDSKLHGTHFHAGLTVCKRGHDLTDTSNIQKTPARKRTCLACRRERDVLYRAGTQVTTKGHCINGHPMTPDNRYTNGDGRSRCKPCALAHARSKRAG
jgi:hypothetical protein